MISVCSAIILLTSFTPTGVRRYEIKTIIVDAGHGGHDPGTHGKISKEKDIALKIALKFGKYVEEHIEGVKVIYTRDSDKFIPLETRAQIANKAGADLFISVHCNALPQRPSIYGTETYVMGTHKNEQNLQVAKRENSVILLEDNYQETYGDFDPNTPESHVLFSLYQTAYQRNSFKFASLVEDQFKRRVGRYSRGVKQAGFWVLWRTAMPSVLIETGYLTNSKEERELNDELKQDYIASGIFRAFRDYKEQLEAE